MLPESNIKTTSFYLRFTCTLRKSLIMNGAGECHFHFLIARKGIERHDPATVATTMQTLWNDNLKREVNREAGLGRAKIEPFDFARQLSGVAYCLKREFDESGKQRDRQDYISPKLFKHLGGGLFNENYLFN